MMPYYSIGFVNMECSEEDIYTITDDGSKYDFEWRRVGRRLVGDQKVMDIDRERGSENEKREKMLLEWKRTKPHDCTYHALVKVLRSVDNKATADRVEELEKNRSQVKKITQFFKTTSQKCCKV